MEKDRTKDGMRGKFLTSDDLIRWGLLIGVTLILTVCLYPSLVVTQHVYELGDIAERDIKAPKDLLIEDKDATAQNRQKAVDEVLTVYDHDRGLARRLSQRVQEAFGEVRAHLDAGQKKAASEAAAAAASDTAENAAAAPNLHDLILEKKPAFEEKLGLQIGRAHV